MGAAEAVAPVATSTIRDLAYQIFPVVEDTIQKVVMTVISSVLLIFTGVMGLIPEFGGLAALAIVLPMNFFLIWIYAPMYAFIVRSIITVKFELDMNLFVPLLPQAPAATCSRRSSTPSSRPSGRSTSKSSASSC